MRRVRGRSWAGVVADAALTVAAVLGTLCIVLVIAAAFFDVRIILFSTGSMSPTIPAGSAAVVRSIPASEVRVGDVITVDRPGKLPITHRATTVSPVPGSDDLRRITMRGDANPVDDPVPYDVAQVRLVVFSVPGIAPTVAALGNPWVLGGLTIGATALVIGVFWPRSGRRSGAPAPAGDRAEPAGVGAGTVIVAVAVLAGGGVLGAPGTARADTADDVTVVQGEVIRLVSIDQPQMSDLLPGASASWQVGVSADAETPGTITVSLSSTGDAALDLRYAVRACAVRWVDGACPSAATLLTEQPVPLDGVARDILSMASDEQRWVQVLVTRPLASDAAAAGAVDITLRALGVGDDVSTGTGDGLAPTGSAAPWTLGAIGALLLAVGAGVAVRTRRTT